MKILRTDSLLNLCADIDLLPEDGIIYISKELEWIPSAEANLYLPDEGDDASSQELGQDIYFLEVDTAKEVIEVWNNWNGGTSGPVENCTAVIYYAKFDSYKEPDIWCPNAS